MANQAIALQARAPRGNFLGPALQEGAQMVNMMRQQEVADRQAEIANQQLALARAREAHDAAMRPLQMDQARATLAATQGDEARAAELQPSEVSKTKADADQAQIKNGIDFLKITTLGLTNAKNRDDALKIGAFLKQQFPMFEQAVDQSLATLPTDPAMFESWRRQTVFQSQDGEKQLGQQYIQQRTGDQTSVLALPNTSADPNTIRAVDVPGSRRRIQPTPKAPSAASGRPRAAKSQQGQSSPPGPWDAYRR